MQLLRLARVLRTIRTGQSRTAADVAEALDWSERRLLRLETAAGVLPQVAAVDQLLSFYGVGGQRREDILHLVTQARRKRWWQAPELALDEGYAALIGFEAEARVIRCLELGIIPGLAQTRAYATALIAGGPAPLGEAEVQRLVDIRMTRQERLSASDRPFLDIILGEAALHWMVGDRWVMAEQLEQLIKLAQDPRTTIRVVPFESGSMAGLPPFTVLTLTDALDPEYLYLEDSEGGAWSDDPDRVLRFVSMRERVIPRSLPTDRSILRIGQLLEYYTRE